MVSRVCNQDYTLPGTSIVLKKGQRILIPIYSLHNDPKYYENPEKFIPERFANSDIFSKPYLPFGDGPRICPGVLRLRLVSIDDTCNTLTPWDIFTYLSLFLLYFTGRKLAKDEIKYCLARLLLKFSFEPTDKTEIPFQIKERGIFISPKNGIILSIKNLVDWNIMFLVSRNSSNFPKFLSNLLQYFLQIIYDEYFKSFASLSRSPHVVTLCCENCFPKMLPNYLQNYYYYTTFSFLPGIFLIFTFQ